MPVVAIDGPVGSGKSTVARAVADRLGLEVLETGAMYRAVAAAALRAGIEPGPDAVDALVALAGDAMNDGIDGAELRTPAVNRSVSVVAALPAVRAVLAERQRAWVEARGGGVVEGRDIGTVVLPGADLKVFLTASAEERARRRDEDEDPANVARRDQLDSTRTASPLAVAADAVVIDTTGRSVDDIVAEILGRL